MYLKLSINAIAEAVRCLTLADKYRMERDLEGCDIMIAESRNWQSTSDFYLDMHKRFERN